MEETLDVVVLSISVVRQAKRTDKDLAGSSGEAVLVLWELRDAVHGQEHDQVCLELELRVGLGVQLVEDLVALLCGLLHGQLERFLPGLVACEDLTCEGTLLLLLPMLEVKATTSV
ncbi:hypothetical protein PG996_005818 [Apiospora saccharicola]|uniref:Uncharacterized protein n=1 Tax=Apiospora saccharicola TaxID=335842 RepID=A0ABR1VQH5_9PEZI